MIPSLRHEIMITPVSTTNAGTASGNIDTLGYDWVSITVTQGTSNAVSNNLSVCTISQGQDTNLTNATAIASLTGDGASGFTIPNADTSNPQIYVFNLDLRTGPRERYLHLQCSPLTTQIIGATAVMGRGKIGVDAAADANAALLVEE